MNASLFSRSLLFFLGALSLLFAPIVSASPEEKAKETYMVARQAFIKQDWTQAKKVFEETLALLLQAQGKDTRGERLLVIGRSDVRFHLAQIAEREQTIFSACKLYHQIHTDIAQLTRLSPDWPSWPINTKLPDRFRLTSSRLALCQKLPTLLRWTTQPPDAKVEILTPLSQFSPAIAPKNLEKAASPSSTSELVLSGWKPLSSPILHPVVALRFRISAPDHETLEQEHKLAPWQENTFSFTLKKKKILASTIIRRPPPPPPKTTPVWVWVTVGVGVAVLGAGIAAAIVLSNQPLERVRVSIQ